METHTLHITLNDLLLAGLICSGLTFSILLATNKSSHRAADRLLALALLLLNLWTLWQLGGQIGLETALVPNSIPLLLLPAPGPLIYWYVRKTLAPDYLFNRKALLHFSPLLLGPLLFLNLQLSRLLVLSCTLVYLYRSLQQIKNYDKAVSPVFMDRSHITFRWLVRLLAAVACWYLLWYFWPVPDLLAMSIIAIAAMACSRPELMADGALSKQREPELRQRAIWLKQVMKTGRYYQDPELTLTSLARQLSLTTHELSRIINTGLQKSFPDFINSYRVAEVIRKMQDPAYDRLNLAGIAYDSGFNSKSSFHRIFKEMAGQSPAEYKKELPVYKLRPGTAAGALILQQEKRHFMFKNYLKVSLRFLLKNRFFSLLNITGLAAGTLCCLYILLYVQVQYSYDRHHQNANAIFRVTSSIDRKGDATNMATASPPIAPAMKNDFPEVLRYTRVIPTLGIREHLVSYKAKSFYEEQAIMVDSSFFKVFTYHFEKGSPANAFNDVNSIVLLKSVSDKLFGDEDPIGNVITITDGDGKNIFKVGGVVDNSAGNTQIVANLFIRLNRNGYGSGILSNNAWAGNNFTESYVMLRADANPASLEKKLPAFLHKYGADQLKSLGMSKTLHLQPLTSIHTTSGYNAESGKIVSTSFLRVLILIAILIQLIACINFMNLSTAKASQRAKEVGVRKVIGAGKRQLISQFLGESFLLAFIGILVALPLLWLVLPYLNEITHADVQLSFLSDPRLWLTLSALILITGLAAGGYPAFYMSAFQAIKVIKGNYSGQFSTQVLRRSLVVFQFVISIVLITGVIVIYSQLDYIRNRDLGFSKDQQIILTFHTADTKSKMAALASDLQGLAGVRSVSRASNTFGADSYFDWGVYLSGMNPAEAIDQQNLYTDEHFVKTMGLKLAMGRDLMPGDSGKVLINETLAKQLAIRSDKAMGTLLFSEGGHQYEVAGVVRDFNFKSLHNDISPFMIIYAPKAPEINNLIVNINTKDYATFLGSVKTVWHKNLPQTPFVYTFMNERMQSAYETDIVLSQIINSFTLIAILISCLGLFGLTAFSAEQRIKEIGVRKVLGASVSSIVQLLGKDFLKLVVIAFVIAAPLAWLAMRSWLQSFVYRVAISWWMFALSAVSALLIALLTVSFQAIKAALANPVKSLRSE